MFNKPKQNLWQRAACLTSTYHLDPDRYALLCFNLVNGNPAILAVQNSLDETALRVTRAISKLWHPVWTLVQNGKCKTRNSYREPSLPLEFTSNNLEQTFR